MKKAAVLLIAAIMFIMSSCGAMNWQYTGIDSYESDLKNNANASAVMPVLSSLPSGYVDAVYNFKHVSAGGLSYREGMVLFVKYNTDTYGPARSEIASSYDFLEGDSADYPTLPYADFTYKGYRMNIVPIAKGEGAGLCFGLVGFNSEKNRICFLYCNDTGSGPFTDGEKSAEEMYTEFLATSFYWNDIHKYK